MPRVLRIINRFNLGGITYNVSFLSKYLPNEYETLLIGGPEEEGEESSLFIPQSLGLEPVVIKEMGRSINPLNDYFAYRRIKKIIKEFRPEIVHTHASKAGAIGRLAAVHCKVPVVIHTFHGHVFHGYFGKFKTDIFKSIEKYLAAKSSAIVAISNKQKKELCEIHGVAEKDKTVVIPLGFDLHKFSQDQQLKRNQFRKEYQVEENELAIVIIGRLAPIKNHYLFIDAIEYVQKHSQKKIRAFIIGDGETKAQLIEYIEKKDLSYSLANNSKSLFVFTSWIRNVDAPLAGADVVALTSTNEGTPVSLIEAQAAGKFIVTTNVGGIEDILHPSCGLMSEPGDRQTYLENLLKSVNDFDTYKMRAGEASQQVIEKFSYKRLCSDMVKLYQEKLSQVK